MNSANPSSSTLWATASKEWVVQPKPKPGRKPKKDAAGTSKDDAEQVDVKGRRIQNRVAQRAFRERKQSQLSELQARIQSYEQGEIERNIALQNIAKRLKEENEKLRRENIALQAELSQMQSGNTQNHNRNFLQPDKKRSRDETTSNTVSVQCPPKKKLCTNTDLSTPLILAATHLPSPSSMASTPDSNDTPDASFPENSYEAHPDMDHSSFNTGFNPSPSNVKTDDGVLHSFPSLGCGFCDDGVICLCHEISVHSVTDTSEPPEFGGNLLLSKCTRDPASISASIATIESAPPSILDNLPAYQPPVPLRQRSEGSGKARNSIFPVMAVPDSRSSDGNCSGDPSNCPACGDDAFGKAFCSAMVNTASATCNDCPAQAHTLSNLGCCRNGSNCRNCPSSLGCLSAGMAGSSQNFNIPPEFISTNDAWKKLKAHPNVEFADLSLLAEVVASHSKCSGPHLMMDAPTPISQANDLSSQFVDSPFGQQKKGSPSLQLVPQEVLLECGRQRMRHVHADGVKEALRLLDVKFS
ncbi:hypothetical protein BDN70DRAFT_879843 [Pholiota conissans]|uniref:BZIP domain-containing protein n=1 Tax=Pholiota conissans TaxID=109636 RepID=A0A9P6CZP4_9AGAR|nr:hypothetical protein BDN70DRAFT_879843 [Pholiota conissans]